MYCYIQQNVKAVYRNTLSIYTAVKSLDTPNSMFFKILFLLFNKH